VVDSAVILSDHDQVLLSGEQGEARRHAIQLIINVAKATGAKRLTSITRAHIVGSYHSGEANLALLKKYREMGAAVAVPTTLSSSGMDISEVAEGWEYEKNCEVVMAYQEMGCRAELTCAPYHLESPPRLGEKIAWAESNAVVYANSVLGALTNMTYQYLDLCSALTGRIPETGMYLQENRKGTKIYNLRKIPTKWIEDEGVYPLLGAFIGKDADKDIPILVGLPSHCNKDHLRAMGAAIATTGNTAMFHAVGITPEAPTLEACIANDAHTGFLVSKSDILNIKNQLTGCAKSLSSVCLGAPHFSMDEFEFLTLLMNGRKVHEKIKCLISTSRAIKLKLKREGLLDKIESMGFKVLTDTCTYYGSSLGNIDGGVMTNSAKWAYYAPSNLGVDVTFARLTDCLESAISGRFVINDSFWSN
jgi:predicted aconitase